MTLRNTAYIQEAIYYVVYVLNEKKIYLLPTFRY